jgi:ankyrin repeat protein
MQLAPPLGDRNSNIAVRASHRGPEIDEQLYNERNEPLYQAIMGDRLDDVRRALDLDIAREADLQLALYAAAGNGNMPIIELLLESGAKVSGPALAEAAQNGHIDAVRQFIARGVDVTWGQNGALRAASYTGQAVVVYLLIRAGADIHTDDDFPLRAAVERGHLDTVKVLIAAGADPNAAGGEALRIANERGRHDILLQLLQKEDVSRPAPRDPG